MSVGLLSAFLVPLTANAIWWIVVLTIVFEFTLETVSSMLNYYALSPSMPLEFAGIYDAAKYARSQEYTKAKTIFSAWVRCFDTALFVAFWALDGFDRVDKWVDGIAPDQPIRQGLLYIFSISIGASIIGLPWSIYSTFVLEERFGFNKTTVSTFVIDRLKGLALMLTLGSAVLGGVLWWFINVTDGWFWAWLCFPRSG